MNSPRNQHEEPWIRDKLRPDLVKRGSPEESPQTNAVSRDKFDVVWKCKRICQLPATVLSPVYLFLWSKVNAGYCQGISGAVCQQAAMQIFCGVKPDGQECYVLGAGPGDCFSAKPTVSFNDPNALARLALARFVVGSQEPRIASCGGSSITDWVKLHSGK